MHFVGCGWSISKEYKKPKSIFSCLVYNTNKKEVSVVQKKCFRKTHFPLQRRDYYNFNETNCIDNIKLSMIILKYRLLLSLNMNYFEMGDHLKTNFLYG